MNSSHWSPVNLFFPTTHRGNRQEEGASSPHSANAANDRSLALPTPPPLSPLSSLLEPSGLSQERSEDVFVRRPAAFSLSDVGTWATLLAGPQEARDALFQEPFINRFPEMPVVAMTRDEQDLSEDTLTTASASPSFASQSSESGDASSEHAAKRQKISPFALYDFLTAEGKAAMETDVMSTSDGSAASEAGSPHGRPSAIASPEPEDIWKDYLPEFLQQFDKHSEDEGTSPQESDGFLKNDTEPSDFPLFSTESESRPTTPRVTAPLPDNEAKTVTAESASKKRPRQSEKTKNGSTKTSGSKYTKDELEAKKQAIIESYQSGEASPTVLSKKHQMPYTTTSVWLKRFKERPDSPFFKLARQKEKRVDTHPNPQGQPSTQTTETDSLPAPNPRRNTSLERFLENLAQLSG